MHGYALSKFIPAGEFKRINPTKFDLHKYRSNSSKGCVLDVDLEYPKKLNNLQNDYSLAPVESV